MQSPPHSLAINLIFFFTHPFCSRAFQPLLFLLQSLLANRSWLLDTIRFNPSQKTWYSRKHLNGDSFSPIIMFACGPGFRGRPIASHLFHSKTIIVVVLAVSAPCELPAIAHGQYLLGYRAGLTIANGSFVTFQCDPEFIKTTSVSIECVLGRLVPKVPSCKRGEPTAFVVFRELRGNTNLIHARSRWRAVHYGRGHFEKERVGDHRPVVRAPGIVRTTGIGARVNGVPERRTVKRRGEEVKNKRA